MCGLRTACSARRQCQAVQLEEAELVPIAALESDLVVDDVKEAAAAEAKRIVLEAIDLAAAKV